MIDEVEVLGPPHPIGRVELIEALNAIGTAAVDQGARLELAIYGGAALMLAGNFRFATEDVDVAEIVQPWPQWLRDVVRDIAGRNRWSDDWFNEAVTFHLSPHASRAADHMAFGSYPRGSVPGLNVIVPTAEYMLALKLKAIRILDPVKGQAEADDIYGLMKGLGVDVEGALAILRKFFPKTAVDDTKQRFLLKHLKPSEEARSVDAPIYPR